MKKIIMLLMAIVCLSSYANEGVIYRMNTTIAEMGTTEGREITVYLIKQVGGRAWSKSAVKAIYNSDDNSIKVGRFVYSINKNRAYGQEDDGRSEYLYVAGDYYFNL